MNLCVCVYLWFYYHHNFKQITPMNSANPALKSSADGSSDCSPIPQTAEYFHADLQARKASFFKSKSQSVPSMMKLAGNCDVDLNNSERTARYCKKFEIDPNQLPKPTRFVKKLVDNECGSFPEIRTIQLSRKLLFGAGSAPDLFRRNANA